MGEVLKSYMLRQSKFADRRIFVDLLHHLLRLRPLRDYVYIGLGGPSLEDHKLIHRELGIHQLISIEKNQATVKRQRFNAPINSVKLLCMSSQECIANFRSVIQEQDFPDDASVIVWLDYTSPAQIYSQLQEIQALVSLLGHGDVLRVTLNAYPPSLNPLVDRSASGPSIQASELRATRLQQIEQRLGDFMPPGVSATEMDDRGLPLVISRAMRIAVLRSLRASPGIEFVPLCLLRYADGQQMMTITGILLEGERAQSFLDETGLRSWEFYSADWDIIHDVTVPDLTVRERLFIDQLNENEFDPNDTTLAIDASAEELDKLVRLYKRLNRYYPQFHHIHY